MPGFVIGRIALFLLGHDHGLALRAHHDLVLGLFERPHHHHACPRPGGKQCRLVHDVFEIRARKPRRPASNNRGIDVVGKRHAPHVDLENLFPTPNVRERHNDLAIETPRAQQRWIEHIRPVGGGDDDDAGIRLEAVHFHEELVEGLLPLVVTAAETRAAMATDRIDLVNEHYARRLFLRLFEHVPHPRRADADEHLDEIRAGYGEERNLRLAGDRPRQQRLARARRAHHQRTPRNTAAEALELARILQELDELTDIFLGLVDARHITESRLDLIFGKQLGLALAEREGAAASANAALHLAHEKHEDRDDDEDRKTRYEELHPNALLLLLLPGDHDSVFIQVVHQFRIGNGRPQHHEVFAVFSRAVDSVAIDFYGRDLIPAHECYEFRIADHVRIVADIEFLKERQQYGGYDQP